MLRLRPHHILCILGFRGLGYDASFVENMKQVVDRYFRGEEVKVVEGADDICIKCPHNSGQGCSLYGENVVRLDRRVASLLELYFGERYASRDLLERVAERIGVGTFRGLCRNCPWRELGYCEEGLLQLKKALKR